MKALITRFTTQRVSHVTLIKISEFGQEDLITIQHVCIRLRVSIAVPFGKRDVTDLIISVSVPSNEHAFAIIQSGKLAIFCN